QRARPTRSWAGLKPTCPIWGFPLMISWRVAASSALAPGAIRAYSSYEERDRIPVERRKGRAAMADKKIIAVLGAPGAQGGGVVRAILADPSGGFAARGITRKVDSDKAKALKGQGVEVVAADMDDEKSLEKAFAGAYGVYAVTNFWEHFSGEK